MATMTMESSESLYQERGFASEQYFNMSSAELHRCIEEDLPAFPLDSLITDEGALFNDGMFDPDFSDLQFSSINFNLLDYDSEESLSSTSCPPKDSILNLSMLVNPRTILPVTNPEWRLINGEYVDKALEMIKPYHPSQDHDYPKVNTEDDYSVDVKEESNEDEPVVDVWKIENFSDEQPSTSFCERLSGYRQTVKRETRRSTRTAEIRLREQARKISNAVHAVLNIKRPGSVRQYKSIKPKNSVETTPSQSDIEDWYSQPVRPTYTKITKKKTSKGRTDHSESERHRREVLRRNFHSLSQLIPANFLRGEKASNQISKQKILNGAKSYILEVQNIKKLYKKYYHQNKLYRELFQKQNECRLLKCVKKQK